MKQKCNTIAIYKGLGINLQVDRRFLRDKLQELTQHEYERWMIKSVTIYYPCYLLQNGVEFWDVPGIWCTHNFGFY